MFRIEHISVDCDPHRQAWQSNLAHELHISMPGSKRRRCDGDGKLACFWHILLRLVVNAEASSGTSVIVWVTPGAQASMLPLV